MTIPSLQQLALFLNKYKLSGRVADFGGTDNIGAPIIKRMLSLNDVEVVEGEKGGADINILTRGSSNKRKVPEYVVLDYDNGIDLLKPIRGNKFDGGICMDLLEHTSNPFIVATNIINSLKPGAMLFVTVPFIWEYHAFPQDFFRFTCEGVEELFKSMKKISVKEVRDWSPEEGVPRTRIVAVFKKK